MQRSLERVGASIFDAASAPVRLQILRLLSTKGQLQYTEIMFQLKLDPVRDAGKFVYHLKSLTAAGLATLDKKTKRYEVTELGNMIVSFARDMDEYVNVKRGKLYVRTSRLAIEEFHRNKISRSLVIEGGVPQEIADEIAAEAEDRLVRLKTIYLTAPLIREFVNAILIEKKLEEYRHKLTRLGMPVYDVAQLISDAGEKQLSADYVARSSARSVLSEYALLNCLPHKIADAHLSGLIHIANLENWILKPNEVIHDLRYFLANNFRGTKSPESLEGALALIGNVLENTAGEISGEQTLEFFNVFLSPFAKGRTVNDLSTQLTHFLTSMRRDLVSGNPQQGLSIVIDTDPPEFILKEDAVGPAGKVSGHYADYTSEAFQLAEATIDAFAIASCSSHLLPHLVIRIRKQTMNNPDQRTKRVIEKAHELAANKSIPYFELLNDMEKSTYSATGLRLTDDWTGQWEADCVRTGSMDSIFLNLPRIAYEAKNNDDKLFMLLKEATNLAIDGFKEKRKFITERLKQPLLPLLAGNGSVAYFYDKSACYNLAFVGLSEAVEFHLNKHMEQDKTASELGFRILRELSKFADAASKALELRIRVSQRPGDEAAGRLAELDIEEYGRAVVIAGGNRGPLYYSDMPTIPLSAKTSIENRILLESQLQQLMPGGHLNVLCVASPSPASSLESFTRNALFSGSKFQTYTRNYSSCNICNETEPGIVPRCSKCGSDKLTHLGRSSYGLIPFNLWPESKRRNVETRTSYLTTS